MNPSTANIPQTSQSATRNTRNTSNTRTIHPIWLRITQLVECGCRALAGDQRLAHLQRIAVLLFPLSVEHHARRLARRCAAMAFRCDVAAGNYLAINVFSGRLKRQFFPLSIRQIVVDLFAALKGKLTHDDPRHYNAVQRAAYLFVMLDIVVIVMSGLVLWKSVQFPLLRELLGGYESARRVHFFAMSALVGFFVVHVVMVALVPRTLIAMIRGR